MDRLEIPIVSLLEMVWMLKVLSKHIINHWRILPFPQLHQYPYFMSILLVLSMLKIILWMRWHHPLVNFSVHGFHV
ncbi:MAG: hypothetical protein CL681_26425 [Blastopirellula sp.]|nr:hypothetical protein [Blastopirellula sp.]